MMVHQSLLAVLLLVALVPSEARPHIEPLECEICQLVTYNAMQILKTKTVGEFTGGLDVAIMEALTPPCALTIFRDQIDFAIDTIKDRCEDTLPEFEEALEETLAKRHLSDEAVRHTVCVQRSNLCEKLWTDEEHIKNVLPNDERNALEAKQYFAALAKKPDVLALASGVYYEVIHSGNPKGKHPTLTDTVTANYEGKTLDGFMFDSSESRGRPGKFVVSQVIAGWTEVLQLMVPGDKWLVSIPSHLAYGENGSGPIQPNAALVFSIELLTIKPTSSTVQAKIDKFESKKAQEEEADMYPPNKPAPLAFDKTEL